MDKMVKIKIQGRLKVMKSVRYIIIENNRIPIVLSRYNNFDIPQDR